MEVLLIFGISASGLLIVVLLIPVLFRNTY